MKVYFPGIIDLHIPDCGLLSKSALKFVVPGKIFVNIALFLKFEVCNSCITCMYIVNVYACSRQGNQNDERVKNLT